MKSNADLSSHNQNSTIRFTPRQLIKYHIEHPEIPIRDEDIENLVLDFPDFKTWNTIEDDTEFKFINKNNSAATLLL